MCKRCGKTWKTGIDDVDNLSTFTFGGLYLRWVGRAWNMSNGLLMKEKNETVDNFPKEVEHVPPPKATTEGKRGPGLGWPGGSSCRLFFSLASWFLRLLSTN